ncbi:hypothetical protein K461DRAFT_320851 [Myriangium duriaei CBS 260.36]|uniref:ARID domain-containing protein n=1 Tax=Myriangium duriaei CBS 260.36 TaxID=1168546 RepID=A0A9P4J0W6_9PEZI|nr:hypothetical protein K461DRAFT_320851 [Myriangium duriaei CBS 260.36]
MPPKGAKIARFERESSIEHTPEYDEFIAKLTEYHEKRGTYFEAEPKVGSRHINLLELYERILGEGGYDLVSDTKQRPLMWRKFAEEFIGKGPHIAAQAFQVKSCYYKNLAAYEISEHWKEDPPPKEILEDLTAKGGNIRGRTLDTFERPGNRETEKLANGDDSDVDEDSSTPKAEKTEVDDTVTTGRSSRGLRQAPPQRVLFQPEVQSSRQRPSTANQASPSPGMSALSHLSHPAMSTTNTTLANYEPRQQYPLTLKPVTTPSNNPEYYRLKRKQIVEARAPPFAKRFKGIMLPGTGFIGPNIYVRAQLALQSGLPDEERYALHHLVKISHERGDKYRFDQFPGLAEALVNKVLQVSSLFYNIEWSVDYTSSNSIDSNDTVDGLNGTPSILAKLQSNIALDMTDSVQSQKYYEELGRITEAGLVIRNMVMLDENAHYVARLPVMKDFATIVLNLNHPSLVELQHYALEIIEQLCVYSHMDSQDILYQTLLNQIRGDDRGRIITALRATARLGMRFRENKRLDDVPPHILESICEWLLINDEELRSAALDFLYQYTSTADNVEALLGIVDVPVLVDQLSKLLLFEAKKMPHTTRRQQQDEDDSPPTKVPRLSKNLVEMLLRHDEPERSSHWLRMCFEDDPNAEMTQIDLWKSYQGTFLAYAATHPHLIAGDFIKNVSNTFNGASAQVAGQNKYVIRGIKPRKHPIDMEGRKLLQCQWRSNKDASTDPASSIFAGADGHECAQWFWHKSAVFQHVLTDHLAIPSKNKETLEAEALQELARKSAKSAFSLWRFDWSQADPTKPQRCCWSSCNYSVATEQPDQSLSWMLLARHIDTHLPDRMPSVPSSTKPAQDDSKQSAESDHHWLNTSVDESLKDPCGLPLGAVLCLRNIARALGRMPNEGEVVEQAIQAVPGLEEELSDEEPEEDAAAEVGDGENPDAVVTKNNRNTRKAVLVRKVFGAVRQRLFFTLGHNHVLKDYLGDVLRSLARSGAF